MPFDFTSIPRVPNEDLRLLWIDDYWDGPLSGMLGHDGKRRWYECPDFAHETDDAPERRYVIRDLTDAQIAEEERWQALFIEHVGGH